MEGVRSCTRVLVHSGSIGNYISAQCQARLELEVKQEANFERLTWPMDEVHE